MKTLILSLALASVSFGAVYTINGGTGATATGIADSQLRAFRGGTSPGDALGGTNGGFSGGPGVVALGLFSSTFDFNTVTSASQLVSAFTNLSGSTTGAFSLTGAPGNRGVFSLALPNVNINNNTTFVNQNMYLFVGNGTTYANSTEFLVLMNSRLFQAVDDNAPTGVTVNFTSANSTLKFGTSVNDIRTTGSDSSVTPGFATAAPVPETSTSLLGAIGALALLRRRRN